MHATLGIDLGSVNIKLCLLQPDSVPRVVVLPHEGDIGRTVRRLFDELGVDPERTDLRGLVTGTEGRHRVNLPQEIAPVCVEAGLRALDLRPRAVVSLGGEDLAVYGLDAQGRVISTTAGNKCASGTGEFLAQQLGRMDLRIADLDRVAEGACVHKLSARCSVFMKSDCTHRLNKGEASKGDIALSLSKVMADKVGEFLLRAHILDGQVVLVGGVTRNRHLLRFLQEGCPQVEFVVPELAPTFEAFGAALLARDQGAALPALDRLVGPARGLELPVFQPLDSVGERVRYASSMRGTFDPEAEYILGIDGGSTTTKVALIHATTLQIVAAHYGRTHGDPVAALKSCLREVQIQLGGARPRIVLAATTGSSRELLGVFAQTPGVYNEIIAHAVGTTYFEPEVDTLFEIGGQDAKYVLLHNGVPIDYAMNEACSAGTGSFLEESAAGDLDIHRAEDIAPLALRSKAPLKFGEHCSAFINSDIRKAIQHGAGVEDVVAGLVFSIVANYLNRVVGNRSVGERIVLQGGVAKNPAVPLAFAQMTGKAITVPPDPELMGCFGVARLAAQKAADGLLERGEFDLEALVSKEIVTRGVTTCRACDNLCSIRKLEVGGKRYPFGGRCSRFTNARKKRHVDEKHVADWITRRSEMLFHDFAPDPGTLQARSDKVVGVPMAFSVHSLWPFYAWYFHTLGVRVVRSQQVSPLGIAKQQSNYCFPAEIAHGVLQDVLDQNVDYVFLPQFRDMPSMEPGEVHACLCPLTQGYPFFARHAFDLDDSQMLRPLVSFKHGWGASQHAFEDLAEQLGFTRAQGGAAYLRAITEQQRYEAAYRRLGDEVLAEIQAHPERSYVALMGRPYNAFTRDANMGIPRKFTSLGIHVVPYDLLVQPDAAIPPNNYWYFGQHNMKAARCLRDIPNLHLCWVSNFSCAPDSFLLHYVRWMMGKKPYLVLEMDSHTADAGLDTRIEAFLDIVESYRRAGGEVGKERGPRRLTIEAKAEFCDVVDRVTGERVDIRDPRVVVVWPSMGDLGVQAARVASARNGLRSEGLPVPDRQSTQLVRQVASGKEYIPALLVLGSVLQFFQRRTPSRPDEIVVVLVPSTLGPCRTGQYHVFYEQVYEDLGWDNVVQFVGSSENSYREMGPTTARDVWRSLALSDTFTDVRLGLRLLATDVPRALQIFDEEWQRVLQGFEQGGQALDRAVRQASRRLGAIPRRRSLDQLKKVLVVGEIYVRRDTFSVQELTDYLVDSDIFPKVTGVTEWIYYTDYARKALLKEQVQRDGVRRALEEGALLGASQYVVEKAWKHWVEHKVRALFVKNGLVPDVPHDMDRIIEEGRHDFVEPELESEATVSPAVAAAGMKNGYSGVAIIAPFGCLPGRLIEGVYAPWAKARGYPVIALENDGQPYPPSTLARMEVFAHNVQRYHGEDVGPATRLQAAGTQGAPRSSAR
ncbi:MAG: acyl-CoA dehydratase activase [Pseudomonadota bacterium]